jgi:hypothetical protein
MPTDCYNCGLQKRVQANTIEERKKVIENICQRCILNPDGCFNFKKEVKK